jgi:broad specificity phosphatase PhoE
MRPAPAPARILLVRHATCAQTDRVLLGRTLDPPLNHAGEIEAAALAQHLLAESRLAIYASPRCRAQQTAQAIARAAGTAVVTADQLDEVDFGSWSGRSFEALAQDPRWNAWNLHRAAGSTPAGETMHDVQRRILDCIEGILSAHPRRTVALITHAEIIRAALLHYLQLGLDDYHRVGVDPGSVSSVQFGGGGMPRIRINDQPSGGAALTASMDSPEAQPPEGRL